MNKNIIILLSDHDPAWEIFLNGDFDCYVKPLTPGDLSKSGWCYDDSNPNNNYFVIGTERISMQEIDGVITRLPAIVEKDLPHIVEADRTYVAAEMTAFLLACLSSLKCQVSNKPTANCLAGPYMSPSKWIYMIGQMGIPVLQYIYDEENGLVPEAINENSIVTVIGEACLGDVHPRLHKHSKRIADEYGVDFIEVKFTDPDADARVVSVNLWPSITKETAKLMIDFMIRNCIRNNMRICYE